MGAASHGGLARSSKISGQSHRHLSGKNEWQHDNAGLLGELIMPNLKQKSAGRQAAQRLAAIGRRKLRLNRLAKGEPVIPAHVLKRLAALNLPNNRWVYEVCLRELLRGA
jgi:hypothetical protein